MKLKLVLLILLGFSAAFAKAQVTDPMITNWWFNTTNNMYKGILTDVEKVYYTTSDVYVKTSGVPNYYQDGVSHNNAKDLKAIWVLPRVQSAASNPTGPQGGQSGVLIDGSVAFTAGDAQSYNSAGVWNRLAYYFEGMDMDASNGHSTPTNMYHHHFDDLKVHNWDSTQHSPIVGYAWDGYPIYGPYGYKNANGTGGIIRNTTSYVDTTVSTRANGGPPVTQLYQNGIYYVAGCFIEDWVYVANHGTLDQFNGRQVVTPEYPNGTYAYFTTVDAALKPIYPYFIGPKLYGNYTNTNVGPNGGQATVASGATLYSPTSSGINEIEEMEANVNLYPIPVVSHLNIKLKENKDYTVVVYDLKGNVLEKKNISASSKIDMNHLSYGIYFVEMDETQTGKGFITRVVKQ